MSTVSFFTMVAPGFFCALLYFIYNSKENRKAVINLLKKLLTGCCVFFALESFFFDKTMVFECSRSEQICRYLHSTIARPQIRLAQTYDIIAPFKNIEILKKSSYKSTSYQIVINFEKNQITFPKSFSIYRPAQIEKQKLQAFFNGEKNKYVYIKGSPAISEWEKGMLYGFYFNLLILIVWIIKDLRFI